jgi:hypothetical protein
VLRPAFCLATRPVGVRWKLERGEIPIFSFPLTFSLTARYIQWKLPMAADVLGSRLRVLAAERMEEAVQRREIPGGRFEARRPIS